MMLQQQMDQKIAKQLICKLNISNDFNPEHQGLIITPLSSFTNSIYKIEVISQSLIYILKIFKESIPQFSNNKLENQIVSHLGKLGSYQKIYASNQIYRMEQFVDGKIPDYNQVTEQNLIDLTGKLANLTKLNMQGKQETLHKYQIQNLFKIFTNIAYQSSEKYPQKYKQCQERVKDILNQKIVKILAEIVPKSIVFSHNDCHLGNIIISDNEKLTLLDYEFSDYNYRGFDLGNFFNEYASDYSGKYKFLDERQLSEILKEKMIKKYYEQVVGIYNEEEAYKEVFVGRVLSHLFWFFIGLKQINDLPDLDMIGYVKIRHQQFFRFLKQVM